MNKGSIDKFLAEMMRKENNALAIIQMYNKMMTTFEDSITIEYTLESGKTETITIPSLSALSQKLSTLERNVEALSGIGIVTADYVTADGTHLPIIKSSVLIDPQPYNLSKVPTKFYSKNNDLSSKLTSQRTYVQIPISAGIESCLAKKVVLNDSTIEDVQQFLGQSYSYDEIITKLKKSKIKFIEYEDVIWADPIVSKFSGQFDIIKVETIDNKMVYTVNQLWYYNNLNSSHTDLKVGDSLVLTSSKDTIYKISSIDQATNQISLERLVGFSPITVGANVLTIHDPNIKGTAVISIPVSSSEIFIPFIKECNRGIISKDWGSSKFIVSDSLVDSNDESLKNSNTAKSNYSNGMKYVQEIDQIPLSEAIKPNKPTLIPTNFSVKLINGHKIKDIETVTKQKYAEKELIKSEIATIDNDIAILKKKLSQSTEDTERAKLQKSIDDQYKVRKNKITAFASIVSDVATIMRDTNEFSPKYQVRGFFDIPEAVVNKGKSQEIIRFDCEYRYLRKNTTDANTEVTSYVDSNGKKINASYSNWNSLPLPRRTKEYNANTGQYEWKTLSTSLSDPEQLTINQIGIPISKDETVEIRVRSISEVGYPIVINNSEWSDSIYVEFPKDLVNTADAIRTEIKADELLTTIEKELTSLGVYIHLEDSFISGDKQYHHSARNIATDYYTNENKQMSVAQVIDELKKTSQKLEEQYLMTTSKLNVYLTDENGNKITDINNNDTINVFAGYYKDLVPNGSKGEIITKLYYLCIKNPKAFDTELLSYVPGLFANKLPNANTTNYIFNKYEYENYRRYWQVPISYRGVTNNEDYLAHKDENLAGSWMEQFGFASGQVMGQVVYSRYTDITLSSPLYKSYDTKQDSYNLLDMSSQPVKENFIFKGFTGNTAVGGGNLTEFCVHIDHPLVKSGILSNATLYDQSTFMPKATKINGQYMSVPFGHTKLMSIESGQSESLMQLSYNEKLKTDGSIENYPNKLGFSEYDKYLIGKNTCGAYLFLAPELPKTLHTGSNIYNKGLILNSSEIRIPILFQCRMSDYYGESNNSQGRIGGDTDKSNINYSKKIGLDFLQKNKDLFSFDLSVEMQYQKNI